MRFRSHLIISAAAALAIYPARPLGAIALTLAGTLVDLDHLVLYALQTGDWSVVGAVRYDRYRHRARVRGDARPRYGSLRSWLHTPWLTLPAIWGLAAARPATRPIALGVTLHLALDHWDLPVRLGARVRAGGHCGRCGRHGLRLSVQRSGRLGRYRYRVLCKACGEATLRRDGRPPPAAVDRRGGAMVH